MSRPRFSKRHAIFPPGFRLEAYYRVLFGPATRSRRLRSFFFGLPKSRLRTAFVARFFWALMQNMQEGNFKAFSSVVHPDAEVDLFGLGIYRGPNGWKEALQGWLDTFGEVGMEVEEFIDAGAGRVVLISRLRGRGTKSGVNVQQQAAFVLVIEDGMGVQGRFYRDKAEALEAAGLSE